MTQGQEKREREQRRQHAPRTSERQAGDDEHAHVPAEVALPGEGLRQQRPEAAPDRAAGEQVAEHRLADRAAEAVGVVVDVGVERGRRRARPAPRPSVGSQRMLARDASAQRQLGRERVPGQAQAQLRAADVQVEVAAGVGERAAWRRRRRARGRRRGRCWSLRRRPPAIGAGVPSAAGDQRRWWRGARRRADRSARRRCRARGRSSPASARCARPGAPWPSRSSTSSSASGSGLVRLHPSVRVEVVVGEASARWRSSRPGRRSGPARRTRDWSSVATSTATS